MLALNHSLRSLGHRNFRLFFAGQTVSLIGTWMQQVAMLWLVNRLTGSEWLLGLVGFCGQIPSFFLSPVVGAWIDRVNRHRLVILTQTLSMLQAFALAALVFTGLIQVWHIVALSVVLGVVTAFHTTARQGFMIEMVTGKEDLANAIALNSSMVNGSRLVGPALAGLLIELTGEGICFLLNGISFLAVILALVAMRLPPYTRPTSVGNLRAGIWEGFQYAFGFGPIRSILLLMALVSFAGLPYSVLMPSIATKMLHGDATTYGYLMTASGVGALAAAIYLASRRSVLGLSLRLTLAPGVFGIGLIAFAMSRSLWLSLALLVVMGFAMMLQMAASNTILQTIVEPDKRGRVMSFYTMSFLGMAPLGSLLAGAVADSFGAPVTLIAGGVCCILSSLLFARSLPSFKALLRPIYRRMGVLPAVDGPPAQPGESMAVATTDGKEESGRSTD